jgi:hypothetical protein
VPPQLTSVNMERKLTAILSADVAGYSRLMGEDEETTIRTLTAYRRVMATLIRHHIAKPRMTDTFSRGCPTILAPGIPAGA